MIGRGLLAVGACILVLGLGGAACSDSSDSSGSTTKLEEVGPQIAKLRLEVHQLREEVKTLREEVSVLTPATDPNSGLPVDTTTTTPPSSTATTSTTRPPG